MTARRITLGDGLVTSEQGLGGMVFSSVYGPADERDSLLTINTAIDAGITLLDTADIYGSGSNEKLFAGILKTRRDEVQIATKFGILSDPGPGGPKAQGDPAYVRTSLEASLRRLGTDAVDLYYYHRVDPRVPIEETTGALAELVGEGKIRHIGLSEVTAGELVRAAAVHPIAAVQSEWSVFSRDVEDRLLPAAAGLGVGFVAYSPLGRGFLTGAVGSAGDLSAGDLRRRFPRFGPRELSRNVPLLQIINRTAAAEGITAAQLVLAWVHHSGRRLGLAAVPIPGTRRAGRILENLSAAALDLSPAAVAALDGLSARVAGDRAADPLYISRGRELLEPDQDAATVNAATAVNATAEGASRA